jgi:glyoxylase-like metal-dependent hydrolase (beta-lactamase superfamily II)
MINLNIKNMKIVLRKFFLMLLFSLLATFSFSQVTVHQVSFPSVGKINAYIVETKNNVVAIDAGFTTVAAGQMQKLIDSIGKPLKAVLLTHAHVDHYGGAKIIAGEKTPIITTKGVAKQIEEYDSVYTRKFKPQMADRNPEKRGYPTQIVNNNFILTVDGVKFKAIDLGPGEALTDVYWEVTYKKETHAFVGDEVLNDIHGFFQDGHSMDWLRNLERLKKIVPDGTPVYPGHGRKGGKELFEQQINYINKCREQVARLGLGKAKLSVDDIKELIKIMLTYQPDTGTTFLLNWSADLLLAEMRKE